MAFNNLPETRPGESVNNDRRPDENVILAMNMRRVSLGKATALLGLTCVMLSLENFKINIYKKKKTRIVECRCGSAPEDY